MRKKSFLLLALLVALAATGGTFAYTETSESVSTTVTAGTFASVTAASGGEAWAKHDGLPEWTPIERTAGSVTAGDLYYILNPTGYTGRLLVMLYLTNVGELADSYTYMNLQVQAYDYDGTASTWTSESLDVYLTISSGYITFILSQATGDGYIITVDGGSWYCFDADGGILSPSFYIEVLQAAL